MIRPFEFLKPERTHLKAVIAALVAIFVLSGVLAYQVYRSEQSRARLERQHVRALEANALVAYADKFEHWAFNALGGVFIEGAQIGHKGGSYADITRAFNFSALCAGCPASAGINQVWEVDLTRPNQNPDISAEMLDKVRHNPTRPVYAPEFFAGAFDVSSNGAVQSFGFLIDVRGGAGPQHAWLVPLSHTFVKYMALETLRDSSVIVDNFAQGLPPDSLFRTEVRLGGMPLAATSKQAYAKTEEVSTRVLGTSMFPEMTWSVGVLPAGRKLFVPEGTFWTSPALLAAVMILLSGVLMLGIALVRREEELHRLRSDLISGVSHELRTPLAQIRMFAETLLLGRTRTEAERRRSLEVIDQEAKRLSHFVENMLQFAKGEAGRTRIAPEPTSFAIEVRRAVESFAPMCQARGVEVRAELEEGVTAPVDRAALRRIMLNLMENALKYGPDEQRITVGVALFSDTVRLWVDDEGEGIPRLERERVFDSFYRLSRELDRRITGSGIGLAVVRQLATLHGGRAWADEAPGGGARLVVEFPDAYVRPVDEGTGWAVA